MTNQSRKFRKLYGGFTTPKPPPPPPQPPPEFLDIVPRSTTVLRGDEVLGFALSHRALDTALATLGSALVHAVDELVSRGHIATPEDLIQAAVQRHGDYLPENGQLVACYLSMALLSADDLYRDAFEDGDVVTITEVAP